MSDFFSINYCGDIYLLAKSDVEFAKSFGKVRVKFNDRHLVGVVNKKYELLIGLAEECDVPKIEFFADDNILIISRSTCVEDNTTEFMAMQITTKNGEVEESLSLSNDGFITVDERLAILYTLIDSRLHLALYDVVEQILLTPYFHAISLFSYQEEFQTEVAHVCWEVTHINPGESHQLQFYIDKKGQIVSLVKDRQTNEEYDEKDYGKLTDLVFKIKDNLRRCRVNLENKENK